MSRGRVQTEVMWDQIVIVSSKLLCLRLAYITEPNHMTLHML